MITKRRSNHLTCTLSLIHRDFTCLNEDRLPIVIDLVCRFWHARFSGVDPYSPVADTSADSLLSHGLTKSPSAVISLTALSNSVSLSDDSL